MKTITLSLDQMLIAFDFKLVSTPSAGQVFTCSLVSAEGKPVYLVQEPGTPCEIAGIGRTAAKAAKHLTERLNAHVGTHRFLYQVAPRQNNTQKIPPLRG